MNKILDQLVEDKYGYSMRDSDSSTYEKTAGWEKEYVNGFMEEAKSGKYDFVFVCQTESVIDEMDRRKIPYIIVEPDNIVWNKQEAEERAKERQIIKQQWFGRFVLRNNSHIKDSLFQTVIFFQSNPCFAVNREIYKYILLWVQLLNRVKHISDMFP